MKRPNFFLVGASKSGTTSLYYYLKQHPDIFMCPDKEPGHFLFPNGAPEIKIQDGLFTSTFRDQFTNFPRVFPTRDEYLKLFEEAGKEKIIGEATADYLIDPDSPQAIFDFAKDAHIIGILRNPFDAAYSEFLMNQREGEFTREVTFLEALRAENIKDHSLWSLPRLIRTRLYHQHVRRYLDIFPKEQIRLFLFEDLAEPKKLLTETFSFLGVSTEVEIDVSLKYNSTVARSNNANLQAALYRISPSIRSGLRKVLPTSLLDHYRNRRLRANRPEKPPVRCPDEAREFLLPILTPVIQELEELVSRDLSAWLE